MHLKLCKLIGIILETIIDYIYNQGYVTNNYNNFFLSSLSENPTLCSLLIRIHL